MHLATRILLLALLCLTVVPGPMSLVVRAHRHPHRHLHASPPAPAQTVSLPACAQPAFDSEETTQGCKKKTARCLCRKPHVLDRFIETIRESCTPADVAAVQSSLENYCGVDLVIPAAPATTTADKTKNPVVVVTTTKATVGSTTVTKTKIGPTTSSGQMTTSTKPGKSTPASRTTSIKSGKKETTTSQLSSATASASSTDGKLFLGDAGRVEVGLKIAALAAAVAAMGWIFDEL